jgi:HEAT repeat protein
MFEPPPLPRNLEAAFRDLGSKTANTRAGAARDVVRHALADASVRLRAIRALEPALDDPAPLVRSAAALGLGELEAKESLPRLLLRVEDEDVNVRQMALTAIGELGDERALPRLRRALRDARPEVRYQAVIAVGRLAPADEAADALAAAAADPDASVGYIALRVGEERLVEELREGGERATFEPLFARARSLLASGSAKLMAPSAILLARCGDASARAHVLRVVRGEVACDKEDEQEAVELAGELGLTEAIPDLERRAYGVHRLVKDTCRFHARIALARLGHERARDEIRRDLAARRGDRRAAAVVSAGRARLSELRRVIAALADDEVDPRLRDEALALLRAAEPGDEVAP